MVRISLRPNELCSGVNVVVGAQAKQSKVEKISFEEAVSFSAGGCSHCIDSCVYANDILLAIYLGT